MFWHYGYQPFGSGDSKQVTATQREAVEWMAKGVQQKIMGCNGPRDR